MLLCACVHEIAYPDERVTNFSYASSILDINEGSSSSSSSPIFESKTPVSFELYTEPDALGMINIDALGVIHIDSNAMPNRYLISVKVNNASGSTIFKEAMTININRVGPVIITFDTDIKPLIQQKCSTCHTSGNGLIYTDYNTSKSLVDEILRRIQLTSSDGDFMPKNRIPLSNTQINLIKQWKTDGLLEN